MPTEIERLDARADNLDLRVKGLETRMRALEETNPAQSLLAHAWSDLKRLSSSLIIPLTKTFVPGLLVAALAFGIFGQVPGCPTPKPDPPPVDPLTPEELSIAQRLNPAFAADGKPADAKLILMNIYKNSAGVVNDPALKNTKELNDYMHKLVQINLGDQLPKTRRAIADIFNENLGTIILELTPDLRAKINQQFARMSYYLSRTTGN
jgi:hypothetical protein